jgi:hypothetical protein
VKALTNDEYAARVLEAAQTPETFTPTAYYDKDGDCIEFLAKPDDFYAERVDDLVTVYYSEKTNEVVGSLLKGVTSLCEKLLSRLPGFRVEIRHGKVKLEHVFRARVWLSSPPPGDLATITYEKLIAVAEATQVEVALPQAA